MEELKGVRTIGCNYERHLVFSDVILYLTDNIRSSKEIRKCIEWEMELWDQIRFTALVDDTKNSGPGGIGGPG